MFKKLNKNNTILTLFLAFAFFLGLNFHKDLIKAQSVQENQKTEQKSEDTNTQQTENQQKENQSELDRTITSVWKLFQAGGPFMWPLLLSSIIGLAIIMERVFYFAFHKFTKKTFEQDILDKLKLGIDQAIEYIHSQKKYLISRILSEGIEVSEYDPDNFIKGVEREALTYFAQAERGLPVLAAISTIAPLLGFLGTVSGMINAFDAIANAESVNAKIVAAGIKEALITTATGLIIAIPAMAFFQYFQNKVNGFSADIETVANHIYKELLRIKSQSEVKNEIKQSVSS